MLAFYLSLVQTPQEKEKVEQLYHTYRHVMKYIALELLRNETLAEDAVHDAFIRLIRHLGGIADVASQKTRSFVCIVARSAAMDVLRAEKKQTTVSIDEVAEPGYTPDPCAAMEMRSLLAALEQLPVNHKDILSLKVYHGLSDGRIADLLGLNAATVRKRLQRARAALADLVKGEM